MERQDKTQRWNGGSSPRMRNTLPRGCIFPSLVPVCVFPREAETLGGSPLCWRKRWGHSPCNHVVWNPETLLDLIIALFKLGNVSRPSRAEQGSLRS